MSNRAQQIDEIVKAGGARLLARAEETYSLTVECLRPRVEATLEKYLLRDEPEAPAGTIAEFIDQLQAGDLCRAIACERGDSAAWNDLVERYSPTVRSAARSAAGNEDAAEDLAQSIWAELHGLRVRDDGRPASKLAYYSGRGSLAGWLRAVVAQLAIDQHRKQSRLVQTEEDADFDRLGAVALDGVEGTVSVRTAVNPESALTNKLERIELEKALARSLEQLADEDRLLVKLYYFDGLRLRQAGALLGVHEATASRRLTRIQSNLRQQVEEILTKECGWTKSETESSFAELALSLESDIEPLLSAGQPSRENVSGD